MAYPVGVVTRTCTVGGGTALESGESLVLSVVVASSRGLIWASTGWRLPSSPEAKTSTIGSEVSFDLPVSDQSGYRDEATGAVIDVSVPDSHTHTYTATITTTRGAKLVNQRVVSFPLSTGDLSPVDVDTLVDAGSVAGVLVSVPDTWGAMVEAAQQAATSVANTLTTTDAAVAGFVEAGATRDALRADFAQRSYPPVSELHAAHPAAPLVTPTYDTSGQAVHTDVLILDQPFGGYRYWMAMTPYPNSNEAYENPSILASHDGTTWVVPAGLTNPIDTNPPGFLADPCLVLDDAAMYCIYDGSRYKSSPDGVAWSARGAVTFTSYSGIGAKLSPTVIKQGDTFHYWCVDIGGEPNTLHHATGASAVAYGALDTCTIVGGPAGRDLWHIAVREIPDGYVGAFIYCNPGTSGSGSALHLAHSADGVTWTVEPTPLLAGESATPWAGNMVYRGCLAPGTGIDGIWGRLWYSALSMAGEWRIGEALVVRHALDTGATTTAVGLYAQRALTTGASNTAVGARAQSALTTGASNTAVGASAQASITTGASNTAVGASAQASITTGGWNTAVGERSQRLVTTGAYNTAIGRESQANLTTGTNTVAVGFGAALNATTGSDNLAIGHRALAAPGANVAYATTTGSRQISIGTESGQASAAESNNIVAVGYRARAGGHGALAIGSETVASSGHAVAIGLNAAASGPYSLALGSLTSATAAGAVAIGQDSTGASAAAGAANAFVLGTANHRYRMPGLPTANPGVGSGILWNDAGTVKVA